MFKKIKLIKNTIKKSICRSFLNNVDVIIYPINVDESNVTILQNNNIDIEIILW
mgnify:CR=1 FL=1